MNRITLPIYLGLIVWDELEKIGIKKREDPKTGLLSLVFSQDELNMIEKLVVVDSIITEDGLKGISNLKNLKSLSIERKPMKIKGHRLQSGVYIPQDHYTPQREVSSISDRVMSEIERMENLESLSIVGQSKLTSIDVSKLPKLRDLNISGNMRLQSICGLESLQQLNCLTLIGNHELTEVDGLNQCLNNKQIETAFLDPQLFPRAINYDNKTGTEDTRLIDKMKAGDIDIQFFETLTSVDDIKMNLSQMLRVHNLAKRIVHFFDEMHPNSRERIILTQAYLGDMVSYDEESLKHNQTHFEDGSTQGPIHGANGLFNCLHFKTCVCEGYTRGAKYLLTLQGIKSREVSCIAKEDSGQFDKAKESLGSTSVISRSDAGYGHSILLVCDTERGEYGYCDPCWNASYYKEQEIMPYMLMGIDEIKKTHTLSLEEKGISIMSDYYQRERIITYTKGVIKRYQQHKREKMMNSPKKTIQHDDPQR